MKGMKWMSLVITFLLLACSQQEEELITGAVYEYADSSSVETDDGHSTDFTPDETLQRFANEGVSNEQVFVQGTVIKVLKDDLEGARHQKFIVELKSGQTILVAHNIDLAPRIEGLMPGSVVEIYGEYEWNNRGGLIHWTHHDPNGNHPDGYINVAGELYQ